MKKPKPKHTTSKKKRKQMGALPFDFAVLFIVLTLVLFGVVMVFSASYYSTMTSELFNHDMFYYLKRQSMWAILGIVGMLITMRIPYEFWRRISKIIYWVSNGFLLLLPIIGTKSHGQVRWIGIGSLSFQPSEFSKIAVILYLSSYILQHRKELWHFKGFCKAMVVLLIPTGLIAMSNFSSALLLGLMGMTILFVASPRIWYFIASIGVLIPPGILAVSIPKFRYRLQRIQIWFDPWSDPIDKGFQTIQSLFAVASGGLFGLGLGQSRQKTFIPEAHNDIIFAIICEELGLIGAGLVIALFSLLVWRGIQIAIRAKDNYGMLVATGITALIAFQSLINIGVVTNSIPNTGQPLPFISYGGTSLVLLLGLMGILLNISKYPKDSNAE